MTIIGIPLAVLAAILSITWILALPVDSSLPSTPSSSSLTIDGIECEKREHSDFHIHSHLDIFSNGEKFTIPSDIGIIPNTCLYWMHTHEDSGVIHIESPDNRTFILGKFFYIWGEKLSNNQIFDNMVEDNKTLSVYINGKKVSDGTEYGQVPLGKHDEIAMVYGKPPESVPSRYHFPEGL
jgi:hypothetical protein